MKRSVTAIWIFLLACAPAKDLDLAMEAPLVVEGWITDQPSIQYVRISRTVSFGTNRDSQPVDNAVVLVLGEDGERHEYSYSHNGLYFSADSIAGRTGVSYWVEIRLEGSLILSERELMRAAPEISSLTYQSYMRPSPTNPNDDLLVYFPVARAKDSAEIVNFYRWKVYQNGSAFTDLSDMVLLADRFINGNQFTQEFNAFAFQKTDTVQVELQEISRTAFNFLSRLRQQTTTLGSNAAVSQSAISGNLFYIQEGPTVLGHFGTVSLQSETIIIE